MNNDFIGKATLLDALMAEYTTPFTTYSGNRVKVTVTEEQKSSLEEISQHLSDNAKSISSGIEGIGNLLAIADYEHIGIQNDQLFNIGWLLAYLGKHLTAHICQS